MLFTRSLIAFTALGVAHASPLVTRDVCGGVEAISCTFGVTASGTPNPAASLDSEWNYIIGRNFIDRVPSGPVCGGSISSSDVAGPASDGTYTIVGMSVGAPGHTGAQTATILTGYLGQSFAGPWSGVTWTVQSVTC